MMRSDKGQPRPMRRHAGARIDKQSLIVDVLFKPLEARGLRPSFRSIRRLLDVLGVPIADHELLRILRPWLNQAARSGEQTFVSHNGSRNGISAQTQRFGTLRNGFANSRNGISAQTQRFANCTQRPPDSPVRPIYLYQRSPHANPPPKGAPLLLPAAIPNDELHAEAEAARAERFRVARELLAETERRNREAAIAEKEPAPSDAAVGASDADRQPGAGRPP